MVLGHSPIAEADPAGPPGQSRPGPARHDGDAAPPGSAADLDGVYVGLGPVAGLVRVGGVWDGGFGGELSVVRVRERRPLAVLGASAGAVGFAEQPGGRLWVDVLVGTRRTFGIATGIGVGVAAQIDPVIPPRWGASASLWAFAGVIPYVRVGTLESSGRFIDAGIRVALPAARL